MMNNNLRIEAPMSTTLTPNKRSIPIEMK
jgi:hypothetical protein